ncbi:MAG: bifunctional riboflavin kinase/FAD synthetase [Bacteroidetes bacterium]|nr:bifunctional riboflavin kinase/FAD synthetase [Bacteroidota bacterium]
MEVINGIESLPKFNKPVITTGTFDGIHIGHQKILNRTIERAKAIHGESVLVTFHPHPRLVLFPEDNDLRLLNTLEEKKELLSELGLDFLLIIPFDGAFSRMKARDYVEVFLKKSLNAHTLIVGYDHHFGRNREGDFGLLESLSTELSFDLEEIPAQDIDQIKVSSTKIRQALLQGDVKTAAEFLTYPYSIHGKVEYGDGRGSGMGFPTANINLSDERKLIPANGVYAAMVNASRGQFKAMVNIGIRPTFEYNPERKVEVHLFDFKANLYGENLTVRFIEKMRDEMPFSGPEALKQQLRKDSDEAKTILKSYA